MKRMIHDCETYGWQIDAIMRKGAVIKVRVSTSDMWVEFRDSMKKVPSDLKSIGKLIGLEK